jgi:hypothetical protein
MLDHSILKTDPRGDLQIPFLTLWYGGHILLFGPILHTKYDNIIEKDLYQQKRPVL